MMRATTNREREIRDADALIYDLYIFNRFLRSNLTRINNAYFRQNFIATGLPNTDINIRILRNIYIIQPYLERPVGEYNMYTLLRLPAVLARGRGIARVNFLRDRFFLVLFH